MILENPQPHKKSMEKSLHIDMKKKRISLSIVKAAKDAETAEYDSYMAGQEADGSTVGDAIGDELKKL